eukprot:TRINITY_DN617_c1_g1_i2.p2 TRINITY_DN617_c1_g1~~TRINITY_DN617_c1_g1_i2.p2  ORF type:complete len:345 (-),score=28.75 TRINITY_DN617_c1_g1_i2:3072-4106(-)
MKYLTLIICITIAFSNCTQQVASNDDPIRKKGNYLGESKPDSIAKLFAPNFISTNLHERDFTMTPDGKEIYYSVMGRGYSAIAYTKEIDGSWTKPAIAPFSGSKEHMDIEPFISQDGKHFFFMSTRPQKGQEAKPGWFYQNIWVMDRTKDGWSTPYPIDVPINSDSGEYYPSTTQEGTLYFTREDGENQQSIYRSRKVNGKYQTPERLPEQVNATKMQYNALISPDESYLILCTHLKDDAIGRTDYCISFRTEDDQWTELINMGSKVNFPGCTASSPALSPDGKYFFFSSNKRQSQKAGTGKLNLDELHQESLSAQNGNLDLYWISTDFINKLRKEQLTNYNTK